MFIQYNDLSMQEEIRNGSRSFKSMAVADFVALDIETTGLSPHTNEIINIGAVRFRNDHPVEEFNILIKPHHAIPAFITGLTGISNADVEDAPDISEVLPELLDFVGEDIILGHNVRFDLGFINTALENYGYDRYFTAYIDTMRIARTFRKQNKLENLVRDYVNPDYIEQHTGLDDAMNTARVFYVFKKMFTGGSR